MKKEETQDWESPLSVGARRAFHSFSVRKKARL